MLMITRFDVKRRYEAKLKLEGKLLEPWIDELGQRLRAR